MINHSKTSNRHHPGIAAFAILSLVICFSLLFAQTPNLKLEQITVDQGLSQNSVICIYQDRAGFLWFGTLDGLSKYDGYRFIHYRNDLPDVDSPFHNYITAIYEDRHGKFWVGTDAELYQLDKQSGHFTCFGLDKISAICEDDSGTLWIGTAESGIYEYQREQKTFVNHLSQQIVLTFFKDKGSALWIGTHGSGLIKLDIRNRQVTYYKSEADNPYSLSNDTVLSICESPHGESGSLWVATAGGGINRFDKHTETFSHYKHDSRNPNSLNDNYVQALLYDHDSASLWMGSKHNGLSRMQINSLNDFRIHSYSPTLNGSNAHGRTNIWTLYKDHSGVIWAGSRGAGLIKISSPKVKFLHYEHQPGQKNSLIHDSVWCFYEDRGGDFWIGTEKGLSKLNRTSQNETEFINYEVSPNSAKNYPVRAISEDKTGDFWLATLGGGLGRFDKDTGVVSYYRHDPNDPNSLVSNKLYTLLEDESGDIWIGSNEGGLSRLRAQDKSVGRFINYDADLDSTKSSNWWVMAIKESRDGLLWIGTWERGLIALNPKTHEFVRFKSDPKKRNSLSNNTILSIHEDDKGVIWLGTHGGGLDKLAHHESAMERGTNGESYEFTHYPEQDGLPNNVVYGILEDGYGCLWLSTNRGLSRFNPQTETFKHFDLEDGLQSNEFNLGAYYKRRNGEMCFGGIHGFNMFDSNMTVNSIPPRIAITAFKKFGKKIDLGRPLSQISELELSFKDPFFSFEFVALHYKDPSENRYAYMMQGFDRDWNYIGTKREAVYTNLAPGNYEFKVKAANSDGVWNEAGISVNVIIVPPFWKTWWFYLLVGLSLGLIAMAFHQYKIAEVKRIERSKATERERIRKKIAADFHDELGHRITKISLMSNILKTRDRMPARHRLDFLNKIVDNADSLFKEMREFIWQLDSEKASVYELAAHLKSFSEELFDKTDIAFQIVGLRKELEIIALPEEWRGHLIRIFKEAMHNVLKHATGCQNVTLKLACRASQLEITLADDGQGFDQSHVTHVGGLKNMQKRAQQIGGKLQIVSTLGQGTTVTFKAKLT